MAQEGVSKDYIKAIAEALNYLATLCPEGKVFVQIMYDVAVLAGLKALLGSVSSILATLSGAGPVKCDFEKELGQIDYLISSAVVEIADNRLRIDTGKAPDTDGLNLKAVELANEVGRLESSVAYKMANCVSTVVSMAQAVEKVLAQLRQNQPTAQAPSQHQPAPTGKTTGTG